MTIHLKYSPTSPASECRQMNSHHVRMYCVTPEEFARTEHAQRCRSCQKKWSKHHEQIEDKWRRMRIEMKV